MFPQVLAIVRAYVDTRIDFVGGVEREEIGLGTIVPPSSHASSPRSGPPMRKASSRFCLSSTTWPGSEAPTSRRSLR